MATGPDWEINTAPRKKPWLSTMWPWIAAGALMGLMAGLFFLLKGLAAFQQGTTDVGIGYMVPDGPVPTGHNLHSMAQRKGRTPKQQGRRSWGKALAPPAHVPAHVPDGYVQSPDAPGATLGGSFLAVGLAVLIGGRALEGAIYMVMGIALPMVTAIPLRWMGIEGKK